jgi:hypothetical protein
MCRSRNKAQQRNIPYLPSKNIVVPIGIAQEPPNLFVKVEKPDRSHKSERRDKHRHNSPRTAAAPKPSCLPNANHPKDAKNKFAHCHGRKRPRSDRGISEADAEDSQTRSMLQPSSSSKIGGSSCRSGVSAKSGGSDLPSTRLVAVEKHPEKKYERRPRHKTRPDKYELKVDTKTVDKATHEATCIKSKRKRHKKTGFALNRDFKAPNVPQDRLTLKPNAGPGIFHKGKASAPVERRGLPDLTFSEMNFLSKRRDVDDARHPISKDVRPPKKSTKGSAQEVSTFFSRPEQHDVALQGPEANDAKQCKLFRKQSIQRNKSSPARPDMRDPLSMIYGNETETRAFSRNSLGADSSTKGWEPNHHVPAIQRHCSANKESSAQRNQSNSTKSYYSWSATPPQKIPLPAALFLYPVARRLGAKGLKYDLRPPNLPRRDFTGIIGLPPDQSSIRDGSLECYTKHVLLEEDKQGVWDCGPRTADRGGHYTLQDLKLLARLSELDDVSESPAIQSDQHRDTKDQGGIHVPLTHLDKLKHALPTHSSNGEGLETSAARIMTSITRKPILRQTGPDFVSEPSADSAAPRPQVAQSGRQGPFAAGPADHLSLRDSTRLGHIRLTPERLLWLQSTDSPALEVRNRGSIFGNAAQTGIHPPIPLWRTSDPVQRPGLYCEYVDSEISTRYSEYPMTSQAHIQQPVGHSEPNTVLDLVHIQREEHQHDHWLGHGVIQDGYLQDYYHTLSDGHDVFDRALLHGPATFLDDTTNILDDFEAPQLDPAFVHQATSLSNVRQDLASAYDEPIATAQDPDRNDIDFGPKLSEENVAASRLGIDGLQRSQTWQQSLRSEVDNQEIEHEFMGFARPHILY